MSIFIHIFIFLFFQFGFVLSTPISNILKPEIDGKELMKKTMELEEKWSNLIHPLVNVLHALYPDEAYIKRLVEKGVLKMIKENNQENILMFIEPEHLRDPIQLPPHILEYTKRHFGGYQLPMWEGKLDGKKLQMLNGKKVMEELEELGNLYLNLDYKKLDYKYESMLDKRPKFNEKAKIWYMLDNGIVVQNIFSIFAEAKLFIEIVVKTILLTCQLDVNLEMEMNEENANKSEITKCILGKKLKQRNLVANFGKIMNAVEKWKSEKLESRKKFESTFERIVEDSRSIGFEMRKNYLKDKKFFHETQPKYTIFEQMKLYLKEKSESEWNYLNEEILQNIGICIRIFQFASIIQHEILMHILDCPMLIDLSSHKNTLEYLQKSTFLLEKALEETILGTISTELKFNEEIEQLEEKWEELQNKITDMTDMMEKMGFKIENEELEKLEQERKNVGNKLDEIKKKKNEIKMRITKTDGFKRRSEKYGREYSSIFVGFLPELIIPLIERHIKDSEKLTNENAKNKLSLNKDQKVKIVNMLFEIMENPYVTEKTLMSTIDEQHGYEEMKAGENEIEETKKRRENAQIKEKDFFKYLDNLTKIILLDFGIWNKFPPSETMQYKILVQSIIGSNIAIFAEKIIEKWAKNTAKYFNVLSVGNKLKRHLYNLLNLPSHGRLKYKDKQKQFALILKENKQMEMLIENFIHCNNNIEDSGPSNDPMDVDEVKMKEESEKMEIDE